MTSTRPDPALSVVVCSLGAARLTETVGSILAAAEHAEREVEVLAVWQGEDPPPGLPEKVVVLDVFPIGLSHARNRGLAVAGAPVVAFVDDDELVDPEWVGAALAAFSSKPGPAAAFGPVEPLDNRGLPYCHLEPGEPRTFASKSVPPWVIGTGGNMAFERASLLELGGFDLRLGAGAEGRSAEESDVIVRLLRLGAEIGWVPQMGVYHPTKDEQEHLASRFPYGFGMGRVARKHRALEVGARYIVATTQSYLLGRRTKDARRRREAVATLRGFLAGALMPVAWRSPPGALTRAPVELQPLLDGGTWRPQLVRTVPSVRLGYRRGRELLEVWVGPAGDRAVAAGTGMPGRDSFWVLTETS